LGFESGIRSLCAITGPSAELDGIDDPDRKKGSRLEKEESAEAREGRGNLHEIPQKAFFTGGCLLLTRGPPIEKWSQNAAPNTDHFVLTNCAYLP